MIEFAEVSPHASRRPASPNACFAIRWQSSKFPSTATAVTLPPSVVICLRCRSLTPPRGKSTNTR